MRVDKIIVWGVKIVGNAYCEEVNEKLSLLENVQNIKLDVVINSFFFREEGLDCV